MSKELVISATAHETRVAILEDGHLCEIYIEREKEFALVGSIYKGRVTRVLPGMQSAFVDIGRDTDAFLYVSDFLEHLEEYDHVPAEEDKSPRQVPAATIAQSAPETPPAHSVVALPGETLALAHGTGAEPATEQAQPPAEGDTHSLSLAESQSPTADAGA